MLFRKIIFSVVFVDVDKFFVFKFRNKLHINHKYISITKRQKFYTSLKKWKHNMKNVIIVHVFFYSEKYSIEKIIIFRFTIFVIHWKFWRHFVSDIFTVWNGSVSTRPSGKWNRTKPEPIQWQIEPFWPDPIGSGLVLTQLKKSIKWRVFINFIDKTTIILIK